MKLAWIVAKLGLVWSKKTIFASGKFKNDKYHGK